MEALGRSEDVLAKASQVWTMLDDMAENSPESYRQFIQQQLNSAKQHYAPPEPHLCVEARILEPTETRLFVNLCSWNKVPPPQSQSDPVPLSAGKMDTFAKSEPYSIVDIAYNPSVLEGGKNPLEEDQLIRLSLKFVEERYSLALSPTYSMAKRKLKGSLERMRHSLRGGRPTAPPSEKNGSLRKEVTLDQLRNITAQAEDSNLTLLTERTVPRKACLIEEISSAERPEEPKSPAYEVTTRKDASGRALQLEVKVEVPAVRRVSECNLSISKDDLLMECPPQYRLHLSLPESVEEEAASARFFKKKGLLLVTMPVCQQNQDPSTE
ncbi:PREDICTED: PIH1 domain-containing protein 2 [Gekko japonicus]|uniref:PIH1 domain-containing protein 2 n=1 Tax=Gekko japonicus TaxID=146911 RepID=A0ABM1KIG3_GEKJA|nr:PREDICTED: PIH1 domain-containing protein 2 [Gekko japonicus]